MRLPDLARWSVLLLVACDPSDAAPQEEPVEIVFAARVSDLPFACGQAFSRLGTDGGVGTPQGLRLYVHDVRLVDHAAVEYLITLDEDGRHQGGGVALLEFEGDGCDAGASVYSTIRGTVGLRLRHGAHAAEGLRFRIGVPAEYNHAGREDLPAPLGDASMAWAIDDGHVFLATRGRFADGAFEVGLQLGSTGCIGEGEDVVCTQPNRPEIALAPFHPETDAVIVDWAALFSGLPLASPPPGCDEASCTCDSLGPAELCAPLFTALGLEWASGLGSGEQQVFRVE